MQVTAKVVALMSLTASAFLPVLPVSRIRTLKVQNQFNAGSLSEPDIDTKMLICLFDTVFCSKKVSNIYASASNDNVDGRKDPGCLINNPKSTMRQPLIAFDVSRAVEEMKKIAGMELDNRNKPVGAILRGIGGGKTRALEEMRRFMLNTDDVLPIAITFNGRWLVNEVLDDWPGATVRASYALSLIARMASVLYGISFEAAHDSLLGYVDPFMNTPSFSTNAIRAFVNHTIGAVNKVRGERGAVNYVIVMVDEATQMEEYISEKFGVKSITSTLQSALLGEEFTTDEAINVNIALLISSLKIGAFGLTPSRRGIHQIKLPDQLPASEVVDSWWLRGHSGEHINVDGVTHTALRKLASTMSRNMRMCEIAAEFIHKLQAQRSGPIDFVGKRSSMKDLLEFLRSGIRLRYVRHTVPWGLLYSIIYGDIVRVTDVGVAEVLERSIISNAAPPNGGEFVPQSSLMALLTLVDDFDVGHDAMEAILQSIIEYNEDGVVLESFLRHWMKVRIFIAFKCHKELSVSSLLGISEVESSGLPASLETKFDELLPVGGAYRIREVSLSSTSRDDDEGQVLADELKKIEVSAESPIVLVKPRPFETFDLALKLFRRGQMPLYVLLDCKSAMKDDKEARLGLPILSLKERAEDGKQSSYSSREKLTGDRKIPLDDFAYVYMMSYSAKTTGDDEVAYLGRTCTQKFLGPLWETYVVLRSTMPQERAGRSGE